jgi:hypothetical protein
MLYACPSSRNTTAVHAEANFVQSHAYIMALARLKYPKEIRQTVYRKCREKRSIFGEVMV